MHWALGGVSPSHRMDTITMKTIVNPRLIDVFGSRFTQADVDFAIPRLDEDIPLYIDPFLLWNSEAAEYKQLHARIVEFFQKISQLVKRSEIDSAAALLAGCEEQPELGLGYASGSKKGSNIGAKLIADILRAHEEIPQLQAGTIRHMEELQLVVPHLAEDRISDTSASLIKDFLLRYTAEQAEIYRIPTTPARLGNVYSDKKGAWIPAPVLKLPFNPADNSPILLVPLNLLRHLPWINYEDYYRSAYAPRVTIAETRRHRVAKAAVLAYNSRNYVEIERYVDEKEKNAHECKPDPIFKPLATSTLKAKFKLLRELPSGSSGGADRKFEDLVNDLLSSLLYPTLEFAESRVRTISGAHIRDLIFYNDGKSDFWSDLRDRYEARQPVFELKNVRGLETEHVNQLYRYLDEELGHFGILVTRNPTPKNVRRNIIDLHSSKRACILCIDDSDIELMLSLMDSGRDPADAIKKRFVEFTRLLPK